MSTSIPPQLQSLAERSAVHAVDAFAISFVV
jgi:hypothetical protein